MRTVVTLGIESARKYCKGVDWGRGKVSSLRLSHVYINEPSGSVFIPKDKHAFIIIIMKTETFII